MPLQGPRAPGDPTGSSIDLATREALLSISSDVRNWTQRLGINSHLQCVLSDHIRIAAGWKHASAGCFGA